MKYAILLLIALFVIFHAHSMEQYPSNQKLLSNADKQLIKAARLHKPLLLKWSLLKGANPNARDAMQTTPLHYVVEQGDIPSIDYLVERGALVNVATVQKITPLHVAAVQHNNQEVAQWLLNHGASIDFQDQFGNTPLHVAAYFNRKAIVKLLIERGAQVGITNNAGQLPEHLDFAALWHACYLPLKNAVIGGDIALVQRFLAQGIRIDYRAPTGGTPMHWAAASHEVKRLLPLLLTHAADSKGVSAMPLRAQELDQFLNIPDVDGQTPLHWAARLGYFLGWKQFLLYGARLNAQDTKGNTPLHTLVQAYHEDWTRIEAVDEIFNQYLECPLGAVVELDPEVQQASARILTMLCCLNRSKKQHGIELPRAVIYKILEEHLCDDLRLVPLGSYYRKFSPSQLVERTGFRVQRILSSYATLGGALAMPVFKKLHVLIALLTRHSVLQREILELKDGFNNLILMHKIRKRLSCYQSQDVLVQQYVRLLNGK